MAGVFKPDVSGSGGTAASQAEQETGTAIDVFTSPGRQQYHPSAVKAWVEFNGTGTPAVLASYNFTSITDNNTGDYTLNIGTDMSSVNYAFVGCGNGLSGATPKAIVVMENHDNVSRTAGALRIYTLDGAFAPSDPNVVSGVFLGDQA